MYDFIDKTSTQNGTALNRKAFMAMQGFIGCTVAFSEDGQTIIETNTEGQTLTTIFNEDGSITQTFEGEKTIVLTTRFNEDGSITEVIT